MEEEMEKEKNIYIFIDIYLEGIEAINSLGDNRLFSGGEG